MTVVNSSVLDSLSGTDLVFSAIMPCATVSSTAQYSRFGSAVMFVEGDSPSGRAPPIPLCRHLGACRRRTPTACADPKGTE